MATLHATLGRPPEIWGPVPEGVRVNFDVSGGSVTIENVRGRFRAAAMNAFVVRHDGVGMLDMHLVAELDDEACIDVACHGVGDMGADGYAHFLAGEVPPLLPLRAAPVFRTRDARYQHLHRLMCVGVGQADLHAAVVSCDIYVVL